ncbi:MAG: RluA family pseudouridine synthase [Candidatus Saccharibacteria bacterium]|nr:RluA family pseudouridine synthase [Moraxellaceae bacterium]
MRSELPTSKPVKLPTRHGISPSCVWLPRELHSTLLDFLSTRFHEIPRMTWIARLEQGLVLNQQGTPFQIDSPYIADQHIYYYRNIENEERIPFEETILYQDEHLLVADKPHFLPVIPSGKYVQETLLTRLKNKLGIDDLAPIHRIDRETAGLVLFSINPRTRDAYQTLFRERTIHKTYEAIAPLNRNLTLPMTYQSRMVKGEPFFRMKEVEGELNSETRLDILERYGNFAKYQLSPITGKQHQLRVHLAALGIPIVYDPFYPELTEWKEDHDKPLQLLAKQVRFTDPITGKNHSFTSERKLLDVESIAADFAHPQQTAETNLRKDIL